MVSFNLRDRLMEERGLKNANAKKLQKQREAQPDGA